MIDKFRHKQASSSFVFKALIEGMKSFLSEPQFVDSIINDKYDMMLYE